MTDYYHTVKCNVCNFGILMTRGAMRKRMCPVCKNKLLLTVKKHDDVVVTQGRNVW
jgi:hypothetical protein